MQNGDANRVKIGSDKSILFSKKFGHALRQTTTFGLRPLFGRMASAALSPLKKFIESGDDNCSNTGSRAVFE
jgi:hypothetical protein